MFFPRPRRARAGITRRIGTLVFVIHIEKALIISPAPEIQIDFRRVTFCTMFRLIQNSYEMKDEGKNPWNSRKALGRLSRPYLRFASRPQLFAKFKIPLRHVLALRTRLAQEHNLVSFQGLPSTTSFQFQAHRGHQASYHGLRSEQLRLLMMPPSAHQNRSQLT